MYKVRYFRHVSEFPETHERLLVQAAVSNFFCDRIWFDFLMRHLFSQGSELRWYVVEETGSDRPWLVVPLRYTWSDPAVAKARVIAATSHVENYSPLALIFSPEVEDRTEILIALFKYLKTPIADNRPSYFDVLRLWPLETGSELAGIVRKALRLSGFWVQSYANSFNRYENTAGLSYEDYFASRSSNMRYNVRRRRRNLEKDGALELQLYCDNNGLERAIAEYIAVSKASWKQVLSMINEDWLDLIRITANQGCLRFGILRLKGKAVAVQFWIVASGIGYCVRLAYDEAYKKQAVGVVLTDFMIEHVLDHDHVTQLDFGFGEDEYKESWMKESRYYSGYMAFNPRTICGFYYGIKHIAGQPLKRGIKWLLRLMAKPKQTA